jgi:hypothetical protein
LHKPYENMSLLLRNLEDKKELYQLIIDESCLNGNINQINNAHKLEVLTRLTNIKKTIIEEKRYDRDPNTICK